jgi:hypothetical protein
MISETVDFQIEAESNEDKVGKEVVQHAVV